jgi:hypothetical protein
VERFWSKVSKSDGCWLWIAYRDEKGYGAFGFKGKVQRAHRVAYELALGPIAPGMHVLHSCDNPSCVNPSHLRLGTHADNMRDRIERGRNPHLNRTQCIHGHPFDAENTYVTPDGRRSCRACHNGRRRDRRRRAQKESA